MQGCLWWKPCIGKNAFCGDHLCEEGGREGMPSHSLTERICMKEGAGITTVYISAYQILHCMCMKKGADITTVYISAYQILHVCTETNCVLDIGRQRDHVGEGQSH